MATASTTTTTITIPSRRTILSTLKLEIRGSLWDVSTAPQRAIVAEDLADCFAKSLKPQRWEVGEVTYLFCPFVCPVNGNFYVDIYAGAKYL